MNIGTRLFTPVQYAFISLHRINSIENVELKVLMQRLANPVYDLSVLRNYLSMNNFLSMKCIFF